MKTKKSTKEGSVTRTEKNEQKRRERNVLNQAKKKLPKPYVKVSDIANTHVSGGTEATRKGIKMMLEGYVVKK